MGGKVVGASRMHGKRCRLVCSAALGLAAGCRRGALAFLGCFAAFQWFTACSLCIDIILDLAHSGIESCLAPRLNHLGLFEGQRVFLLSNLFVSPGSLRLRQMHRTKVSFKKQEVTCAVLNHHAVVCDVRLLQCCVQQVMVVPWFL